MKNRCLAVVWLSMVACPDLLAQPDTRDAARAAMRKAVRFFAEEVAVEGGYVWRYSADLSKREGEGKVARDRVWVQPPATPTVGEAFVSAYEATGDPDCLAAARAAARVLLRGQYHSGGWQGSVDLSPALRAKQAYRVDGEPGRKARNYSSLDDDKTQSALRMLMRYDRATGFKDAAVHEAVMYGLDALLAAQAPNGGWAQVYTGPYDGDTPAGLRASYPEGEPTRVKEYWHHFTLNDGNISRAIDTLLLAHEIHGDARYRDAALRAGDFLRLAQMPDPQPGWAQQYDARMRPAWARKFEPAAISGSESQAAMATLMDLFERSGERRFLEPIPKALAYYRASLLPDGRLARFYELRGNRPLYMTRDYKVTYKDDDLPTHYSFKVGSKLEQLEARYRRISAPGYRPAEPKPPAPPSESAVRRVIAAMDERGAWVEEGTLRFHGKGDDTRRIIDPRTFCRNLAVLARFVGRR